MAEKYLRLSMVGFIMPANAITTFDLSMKTTLGEMVEYTGTAPRDVLIVLEHLGRLAEMARERRGL